MNTVLCNRVKALCESLGGTWAMNDLDWLECKIEGLRVCIGPTTGMVEVNEIYGSKMPSIFHHGDTDLALIKITEVHKIAKVQVERFQHLVNDVAAFLRSKKIQVEVRRADGDYAKFLLGDRELFSLDADYLLDGGPYELHLGIAVYGVETLDEVIECLNKTTQQDVEAPWMVKGPYNNIYYIGDIAYLIPAMIRHGVENVNQHIGTYWTTSGDTILNILLGNELPCKKNYFSIRFVDGVIPTEVEQACNS
jgi:hypothetical protein